MAFEQRELEAMAKQLKSIGITVLEEFQDIYRKAYAADQNQIENIGRLRITIKKKAQVKLRPIPKITIRHLRDEVTEEDQSIREIIDVQSNDFAKNVFIDLLRARLRMPEKDWFSITQLIQISNQLNLPFIAIPQNSHWYLMLRPPAIQVPGGQFGAWVYDPMNNGEVFLRLDWTPDAQKNWQQFLGTSLACSNVGKQLAKKGKYNLSLKGESSALQQIKHARKQFDWWNCGPICLFQAVLLSAVSNSDQAEFEVFIEKGLKDFEAMFGIDVLTREEILSN